MSERAYLTFKEAMLITLAWWIKYALFFLCPAVIFMVVMGFAGGFVAGFYELTRNSDNLKSLLIGVSLLGFLPCMFIFDKRFMYKAIVKNYKKFSVSQNKEFFTWGLYTKVQCLRVLMGLPIWVMSILGEWLIQTKLTTFQGNLLNLCMVVPYFLVTSWIIKTLVNKDYGERSFQVLRKLRQKEG